MLTDLSPLRNWRAYLATAAVALASAAVQFLEQSL